MKSRAEVSKALGAIYTRKMGGEVWAHYDDNKRAYAIRGEGLPAHPDLREQYPRGWSLLDWVAPTRARQMVERNRFIMKHDIGAKP